MNERFARLASRLLVALPVLSLALSALAWLRYGLDMPWFDDWRGYAEGTIASLDPGYLFRPVNDTMAPVGLALDALAQRFIDGNSVVYQFLSMTIVLGSLLLLQWALLRKALGSQLQAAACFSLTVLMLQPDSYWGRENLAYHQCLPLVFLLGAVWLIVCSDVARRWHFVVIPLLGLLAGFTYISGAVAVLTAGVSLLGAAAFCQRGHARRQVMTGAALLTAAGALTSGIQVFFFMTKFHEFGTHAGIPMALPSQASFWMFYVGKIARSLLIVPAEPALTLGIAVLACFAAAVVAIAVLRRAAREGATAGEKQLACIYIPLCAVVFVYMLLVAAGRTNYRPAEVTGLLDIYVYAFTRFHFFWAALLWPWVAAGAVLVARTTQWAQLRSVQGSAIAAVLVLAAAFAHLGAYGHMRFQQKVTRDRLPLAHCLLQGLQSAEEIHCVGLLPPRFSENAPDALPAYLNARKMGASFVRYFPLASSPRRSESLAPFFVATAGADQVVRHELQALGNDEFLASGNDPQIHFDTRQPQSMNRCIALDVDVEIKAGISDTAQVYFRPLGSAGYEEASSVSRRVEPSTYFKVLSFRLESPAGFEDQIRLDPVTAPQALAIREVRMYCVRQRP